MAVAEVKARELSAALADLTISAEGLRVTEVDGGLACLMQVWPAARLMPAAAAERRRRANGARSQCRQDILSVVRAAGKPLTRKG